MTAVLRDSDLKGAVRARLHELVAVETPSGDIEALERFMALLETRWATHAVSVRRIPTPAGPVLVGDRPGRGWGASLSPVLLIAHADTVWPRGTLTSRVPWVRDGDNTHGPGIFDMKAGIVLIETLVRLLAEGEEGHPPLRIFVAPDEEVGSAHSVEALRTAAAGCLAGLGFESPHPDGCQKIGRFGSTRLRLRVTGRPAHAALDPGAGISAIDEIVDQLLALRDLLEAHRGGAEPVLFNVGSIRADGKTNVVAEHAEAEIGLRFARGDQEKQLLPRILDRQPIRAGAVIDVELLSHRPAWAARPADTALGGRLLPGAPPGRPARGSADTNMLVELGMPLVDGLGARGAGAHAVNEHIVESSMWERLDALHRAFTDRTVWAEPF